MLNIELFNEYVAHILAQLYVSFPVKGTLDVRTISGHTDVNHYGIICAPDGSESKEAWVAFDTISWLVDNGYVHADSQLARRYYDGCTLTAKGLKLLQAVPKSVQITEPPGGKLVSLIKEGSINLAKDLVKEILTHGAGGAI